MQEPEHFSPQGQEHRPAETAPPHGVQAESVHPGRPLEERVRHWHHWRTSGILTSAGGVVLIIAGHFSGSGRAMQVGGFFMLAGAVIFTVGVIGGWLTRAKPLD